MLFTLVKKGVTRIKKMKTQLKKNKEYQTLRLFATLGVLTFLAVMLFRVVLFGPSVSDKQRQPAEIHSLGSENK